jgi:hypothetical protein
VSIKVACPIGPWRKSKIKEPPYKRATFETYEDCVAAGRSQVDTMAQMSPDISWQCLLNDD